MQHHLACNAPICAGDPNPNYKKEVIWFAGERVCGKTPLKPFQKIQNLINEYLKIEGCFTVELLEKRRFAYKGMKGFDENAG